MKKILFVYMLDFLGHYLFEASRSFLLGMLGWAVMATALHLPDTILDKNIGGSERDIFVLFFVVIMPIVSLVYNITIKWAEEIGKPHAKPSALSLDHHSRPQ